MMVFLLTWKMGVTLAISLNRLNFGCWHSLNLSSYCTINNTLYCVFIRVRSGDDALACHFTESHKNATYQSKTTQNELITIIGEQILHTIVNRSSTNGGFFSVIADEDMTSKWKALSAT